MKKVLLGLLLLLTLIFPVMEGQVIRAENVLSISDIKTINIESPSFKNVVLITFDGANGKAVEKGIEEGFLPNVKEVLEYNSGFKTQFRITTHRTSTDPGLSTLETGYGEEIHGISYNYFGVGTDKLSIPDNYTISERLKAEFGDTIKTVFLFPWSLTEGVNHTYIAQAESYGSIYDNMKDSIDYWFASENLTWLPDDPETRNATFHGFNEELGLYASTVLKATFMGQKGAELLTPVVNERFYFRMHMTEPDQAGHGYGVFEDDGSVTEEYKQELINADQAIGNILEVVKTAGVMNETLFIVATDHGFQNNGHQSGPWPGDALGATQMTYIFSNSSVQHPDLIPSAQVDLAPTILEVLGVDTAPLSPSYEGFGQTGIPMWERTDTEDPSIKSLFYRDEDSTTFIEYENTTYLNDVYELKVTCKEWSYFESATLTLEGTDYPADTQSFLQVKWQSIDFTTIDKEEVNITITLTDIYSNTASKIFNIKLKDTSKTSFVLISLLSAITVTGTAYYFGKKKRQ